MNFAELTDQAATGDTLANKVLDLYPTEDAFNAYLAQREIEKAEYAAKREAREAQAMRDLHEYQMSMLGCANVLRYS